MLVCWTPFLISQQLTWLFTSCCVAEAWPPLSLAKSRYRSFWCRPFEIFTHNSGIRSHHFMANRWGNSGNSVRHYFGGFQNHCRWCCSHEIKRRLLLGRKVMTNLDSIFKSRDITLSTKVRLVKAMWSCMDMRVGLWRRLSAEELMLVKCGVGEDSWESLGLQGDPTSPFWRRSALGFLWKEWC